MSSGFRLCIVSNSKLGLWLCSVSVCICSSSPSSSEFLFVRFSALAISMVVVAARQIISSGFFIAGTKSLSELCALIFINFFPVDGSRIVLGR